MKPGYTKTSCREITKTGLGRRKKFGIGVRIWRKRRRGGGGGEDDDDDAEEEEDEKMATTGIPEGIHINKHFHVFHLAVCTISK